MPPWKKIAPAIITNAQTPSAKLEQPSTYRAISIERAGVLIRRLAATEAVAIMPTPKLSWTSRTM